MQAAIVLIAILPVLSDLIDDELSCPISRNGWLAAGIGFASMRSSTSDGTSDGTSEGTSERMVSISGNQLFA